MANMPNRHQRADAELANKLGPVLNALKQDPIWLTAIGADPNELFLLRPLPGLTEDQTAALAHACGDGDAWQQEAHRRALVAGAAFTLAWMETHGDTDVTAVLDRLGRKSGSLSRARNDAVS